MDTMQDRMNELTEGYETEDGMIKSPGKFESEKVDVLYWYDCMVNGEGHYDSKTKESSFQLYPWENKFFKVKNKTAIITLSDSGFVYLEYK